ncbi:MAG: PfkB family carbohydrate kinase, partial [Candidatus Lokiarchaeota archaeon]
MDDQKGEEPSILFIGHLAIDRTVRFKKSFKPSLGGSVSYGSLALSKYQRNLKIGIISHIGTLDFKPKLLKKLEKRDIDLKGIKWSKTRNTAFMLDYLDHNRILTLKSRSPDLNFTDVPKTYLEKPPHIIVLAPLCNEISYEYVVNILEEYPNAIIGIDVQGFLRKIDNQGIIKYTPDEKLISNMKKIIKLIGNRLILKGSEIEMQLISGCEEYHEIMNYFKTKFNAQSIFILTLGERGSWLVKKDESILKVPAFRPKRVRDETGAGDVYLAIFLLEYLLSDKTWDAIEKSAYIASVAASFLVEEKGINGVET